MTSALEVGESGAGVGEIRSGYLDSGNALRGIFTGGPVIQVRDVGAVPAHWEDLGRIPPQDGPQTVGVETKERNGWELGI